jgi:hypothetical protein
MSNSSLSNILSRWAATAVSSASYAATHVIKLINYILREFSDANLIMI